jgi:hypothetical protein
MVFRTKVKEKLPSEAFYEWPVIREHAGFGIDLRGPRQL